MHKLILLLGALVSVFSSIEAQAASCEGFLPGSEQHTKVHYQEKSRRGKTITTVTAVEVYWLPSSMLDMNCYDPSTAQLHYKPVKSEEWFTSESTPKEAKAYSKWIVQDIKPCLKYQFQISVQSKGESKEVIFFQLPETVGPSQPSQILDSGFIPDAPADVGADVGANSATIMWELSDCADQYEINFVQNGEDNFKTIPIIGADITKTDIQELKSCTKYDLTINALLGEEYSPDLIRTFATKPRLDAASNIQPDIETTMNSLSMTWKTWNAVSCIEQYKMTICAVATGECKDPDILEKPKGLPEMNYKATELSSCTHYTVEIQPIYPDTNIDPKIIEFKTLSPDASTMEIGQVETEQITSASMLVSWPNLNCASSYNVYQKTENSEWERVAENVEENQITISDIVACTKYHFQVSAIVGDNETPRSTSDEIMSELDNSEAFEAPGLHMENYDTNVDITWTHALCIQGYIVKLCLPGNEDCQTQEVLAPTDGSLMVKYSRDGLSPCTQYTLEIIPTIQGKEFTARVNEFTTTNGVPQPPANFKATLNKNLVTLNWDEVSCNTGYKIYHKTGNEDAVEVSAVTNELKEEYEDPVPCETYYYAISTLVDSQESEKTEYIKVSIPPREDLAPELKILNNEDDNITLRLDVGSLNEKCSVEKYELTYGVHGESYETVTQPQETDSNDILLSFQGASGPKAVVMGRVLYSAGEKAVWSAQVSSGLPEEFDNLIEPLDESSDANLTPIIVGVVIAVIVIVVVLVAVVKMRSKRSNYDAEKAGENGKQEETQKLNDSHPDA